jgi:5'-deoxynucleotidase YfbR-like HD superfamily hydrolase
LKSQGYETWVDSENILLGESITDKIGEALEKCDIVLVFLSENSVRSNWVNSEWRSKFFEQVNKGEVYVLPLLIENCDIPKLLQDKKYADFTNNESYETSLSLLLKTLKQIEIKYNDDTSKLRSENVSVLQYTEEILSELEDQKIMLPNSAPIYIVETLKKIKRSGKLARLSNFNNNPEIKIRSIYDHTLSVAHLADCLLPVVKNGVNNKKYAELARIIAFHEFNETILGDIPSYSDLTEKRRNSTANPAEQLLRTVPPEERERIANDFIKMFLTEKHKLAFELVLTNLSQKQSNLTMFFTTIDKVDAIIAIWRYLHHYRGKIRDIDSFLRKVRDFFEYPDLQKYAQYDDIISELISVLQDRDYAKKYYKNTDFFHSKSNLCKIPPDLIKNIIEGCQLFND